MVIAFRCHCMLPYYVSVHIMFVYIQCSVLPAIFRVTTCRENLEMLGILTAIREMSGNLLKVTSQGCVGEKSCQGKMSKNCLLIVAYLRRYRYLVASS